MPASRYRWFVVVVFFFFMLLHQADKLLIGPLTSDIMETFAIDEEQMGRVFTGALLVGAVLYPIWGYLYDHFSRPKLLALASFLWGSTTWLSTIAPTYPTFVASRSLTGIDDSSYPGLYSLVADYFEPAIRGKVYGLVQLTQPLGYMLGLLVATLLSGVIGWRSIFMLTGLLGVVIAAVIFWGVKDMPRGQSEPELAEMGQVAIHRFSFATALGLFRKRSLIFLFLQGFVGVFPWNVITYWFFRYLETERNYTSEQVFATMAPAILVLAAGYFIGGAVGDALFKRSLSGRVLTALMGVVAGAVLMYFTLATPVVETGRFGVLLLATALFIPFASANVISTVYDMTLPEVRSTALAVQYFLESAGAAFAPWLAGAIAKNATLEQAILLICISAWIIGALFLSITAYLAPADIRNLRQQLRQRADDDRLMAA